MTMPMGLAVSAALSSHWTAAHALVAAATTRLAAADASDAAVCAMVAAVDLAAAAASMAHTRMRRTKVEFHIRVAIDPSAVAAAHALVAAAEIPATTA